MPDTPPGGLPSVTIYTDGGADPNPGPGGWGAVLIHPASGTPRELYGGEPAATNNRMELTAAIRALGALRQPCRVELHTDSQYLRRGVTEWLPGWIARGFRRKDGELQNEDLWRQLAAAVARHEVRWHWVKGHAGNPYNVRADRLATRAIQEQRAAAAGRDDAGRGRGAAGAAGRESEAPVRPPDFEVFLRVSMSSRGAGWAALIRDAAAASPAAATGVAAAGTAAAGTAAAAAAAGPAATAEPATAVDLATAEVRSGRLPAGTAASANAVDLMAAAAVLETLPAGASVAVLTGSDYLRLGASRWLAGWRQRGWKTKEGGPVQNRELWERLAAVLTARRVTWPEVKGREVPEMDRLAPLAKAAAQGDDGAGAG